MGHLVREEESTMEDLQILGPAQGTFLCILGEELTTSRVSIASKEPGSGFLALPGEETSREFITSGKDRLFFLETPEFNLKDNKSCVLLRPALSLAYGMRL